LANPRISRRRSIGRPEVYQIANGDEDHGGVAIGQRSLALGEPGEHPAEADAVAMIEASGQVADEMRRRRGKSCPRKGLELTSRGHGIRRLRPPERPEQHLGEPRHCLDHDGGNDFESQTDEVEQAPTALSNACHAG
jgi:hypothetical protein